MNIKFGIIAGEMRTSTIPITILVASIIPHTSMASHFYNSVVLSKCDSLEPSSYHIIRMPNTREFKTNGNGEALVLLEPTLDVLLGAENFLVFDTKRYSVLEQRCNPDDLTSSLDFYSGGFIGSYRRRA